MNTMNKHETHTTTQNEEHGTVISYVIGFVLSLIYTILPYQLVVNKVFSGGVLIAIILGIAVLQMAIQLLFFLHLGRGPKPLYNVVFFFATAGVIVLTIGASLFIMHNLYRNMSPEEMTLKQAQEENIAQVSGQLTGACVEPRENHRIVISGDTMTPLDTNAVRCDTLTIVDEEGKGRELRFGTSESNVSYGGQDKVMLEGDKPYILTLNQAGSFGLFDSANPDISGSFTVEP